MIVGERNASIVNLFIWPSWCNWDWRWSQRMPWLFERNI